MMQILVFYNQVFQSSCKGQCKVIFAITKRFILIISLSGTFNRSKCFHSNFVQFMVFNIFGFLVNLIKSISLLDLKFNLIIHPGPELRFDFNGSKRCISV